VTPMSSPTELPSVADVITLFQRALLGHDLVVGGGVRSTLLDLHRNNIEQWQCEDTTRDVHASDATIAVAKRAIDGHNGTRHRLVEAIDAVMAAAFEQNESATPATESPAMVLDRLSVLTIRLHVTEASTGDDDVAARVPLIRNQLAILQEALEGLLTDVREGRKRFVPYQSLKLYGQAPPPEASTADSRPD
jgi:hypothetical protein